MPETCENWPNVVHNCVYNAHQTQEIYLVLPFSVYLKAHRELWNPLSKRSEYLVNVVLFGIKDL